MQNRSRRRGFADCVRMAARDEQIVQACNLEHGTKLIAPIDALLQRATISLMDSQCSEELLCFIGFVHRRVWRKVLLARRKRNWRVPKQMKKDSARTTKRV